MVPHRVLVVVCLTAALSVPRVARGQDMQVIRVQGNVYMLQTAAAGGNVGVLAGPDGTLVVDDQVPNLAEAVVRGIRQIGQGPIRNGGTDRDGLVEVLAMLTDVRDTIREMVADGLDLAGVIEARPTAAYDARWRGSDTWTEQDLIPIIYFEVGGAAPTVPRE